MVLAHEIRTELVTLEEDNISEFFELSDKNRDGVISLEEYQDGLKLIKNDVNAAIVNKNDPQNNDETDNSPKSEKNSDEKKEEPADDYYD